MLLHFTSFGIFLGYDFTELGLEFILFGSPGSSQLYIYPTSTLSLGVVPLYFTPRRNNTPISVDVNIAITVAGAAAVSNQSTVNCCVGATVSNQSTASTIVTGNAAASANNQSTTVSNIPRGDATTDTAGTPHFIFYPQKQQCHRTPFAICTFSSL